MPAVCPSPAPECFTWAESPNPHQAAPLEGDAALPGEGAPREGNICPRASCWETHSLLKEDRQRNKVRFSFPNANQDLWKRPSSPEEMLLTVKVLHNYLLSLLDVLGPKVRGLVPEGAWALNPMTSAHVRRGTTQRQPREGHVPRQAKTRVVVTSPGAPGATRSCQRPEGTSREPAERAQPCPHLDARPPASRPGEVTVLLSTSQCRGLGHRSPRTLIQETHEKAQFSWPWKMVRRARAQHRKASRTGEGVSPGDPGLPPTSQRRPRQDTARAKQGWAEGGPRG